MQRNAFIKKITISPFEVLFVNTAGRSLQKRNTAAEELLFGTRLFQVFPNGRIYFTSNFSFYLKIPVIHNTYSEKLGSGKDNFKKQQLEMSAS